MSSRKATQAPATTAGALPPALPSNLAVAARVAQLLLDEHQDVDHRDLFALNRAHGALTESLRILLRVLGAEPARRPAERCPAADADDPTPCDGPPVVTVLDRSNTGADGCERHAVRLLTLLPGSYVITLPHATAGTACRVFRAAGGASQ
ncbi:hypothetical protein ABZ016_24045 [Streptomyces sp. NPDC006372]|uniref:hypothetical protein n=1 Tax=Streptomyces sp. NPDC006372 TaxID=3155599 RepID=UPI0033BDBDC8